MLPFFKPFQPPRPKGAAKHTHTHLRNEPVFVVRLPRTQPAGRLLRDVENDPPDGKSVARSEREKTNRTDNKVRIHNKVWGYKPLL